MASFPNPRDNLRGNELVMTQELIANMLGVRREGVTEAALELQKLGLIHYARGHIAVLAILSFVFLFAEMFSSAFAGVAVGMVVSVPLAVGISALEIIVVLVQAYVFTLLTAVFIGMAIHVHH